MLTIDPAIIAPEVVLAGPAPDSATTAPTTSADIAAAFGD